MSGASSFVLSLLGFGTAGAVHVGQTIRQKQAEAEVGAMHGYEGTPEVLEMRSKVRKEWWRVCGNVYNACGKPVDAYDCRLIQQQPRSGEGIQSGAVLMKEK